MQAAQEKPRLLGSDLGEQEGQVLRHGIRFVRRGEKPIGLQAAVGAVLLHLQHLILACSHTRSIGVTLSRKGILQGGNLNSSKYSSAP